MSQLYSNSDFTFGVKVLDSDGNVIAGSTYAEAEWRVYEAGGSTPLVSKSLGNGITATSGSFSFFVEYNKADIQFKSKDFDNCGVLVDTGQCYRHAFFVGTASGDKEPWIFNEKVDILAGSVL